MSKNILIVENDAALSHAMKDKLVARGFAVDETTDGKGCAELIRRTRPELVVLAVDLAAGQNGYIICKKLKSDDELKAVPVIIVGNPDGFGQHKKLKTHADDYLGKPFDPGAIIDRAGALIGLPELPAEDDGLNLDHLLDEDKQGAGAEDISLDNPTTSEETVGSGDPDFEMVDAMFDDPLPKSEPAEELRSAEFQVDEESLPPPMAEDAFQDERTIVGMMPTEPPPPPPASSAPARPSASDATDMRALKSRVTELTGSLDEARGRAQELEDKVRELESQLETRQTELETARSAGGKADSKDLFALKDQVNKKDKEILRLKNELNEKDKEVVELHEKETAFEQQISETSSEMARREAQIKTLTGKGDQQAADRKRLDQQLTAAKEEARSVAAKLTTLQADFDSTQERADSMETELGMLRTTGAETETQLSELRAEHDSLKGQHEEKGRELDELRGQHDQAQAELDSTKTQLGEQASAFAEEIGGLRRKIGELEDASTRSDERVKALFARIKSEESVRERTRQSLQQALAALDEQPAESVDELLNEDEIAEA